MITTTDITWFPSLHWDCDHWICILILFKLVEVLRFGEGDRCWSWPSLKSLFSAYWSRTATLLLEVCWRPQMEWWRLMLSHLQTVLMLNALSCWCDCVDIGIFPPFFAEQIVGSSCVQCIEGIRCKVFDTNVIFRTIARESPSLKAFVLCVTSV